MSESLPENPDEIEVPAYSPSPVPTDAPPVSDPEAPNGTPDDEDDA